MWGERDWLKTSYGGKGRKLAENVRIPSYGRRDRKLLKKKLHNMERFLIPVDFLKNRKAKI